MRFRLGIVLVVVGVLWFGYAPKAQAQTFPIVGAVMLIGGGVAIAVGNSIKVANEEPPDELWDDAGWAIGLLNVAAGTAFIVSSQTEDEPPPGALPIGIGLAALGVIDIVVTTWAMSYDTGENQQWGDDLDKIGFDRVQLIPAVGPTREGDMHYGLALSVSGF